MSWTDGIVARARGGEDVLVVVPRGAAESAACHVLDALDALSEIDDYCADAVDDFRTAFYQIKHKQQ